MTIREDEDRDRETRTDRADGDRAYDPCDLLALSSATRLRAIHKLPATRDLPYALRRVLFTDDNATVRAAAARRLGDLAHGDHRQAWLVDAIGDRAPLVRDAILRSLARVGPGGVAAPAIRTIIRTDRVWWVRRTAIYALAASGATELDVFKAALADPFWRVRHAAVRVLAVLGARDLDVRDHVIAAPPSSALTFLRASWGPVAIEAPGRAAAGTSALPAPLLDPDPAVVTARLAADPDVTPLALVELLCDPHAPLRLLALDRLAASRDRAALEAALDWLEEPRIPHVADTVERLLDGLGDDATELAEHAVARPDRLGAARWAIRWIVATRSESLFSAALARAEATPSLRAAALRIAPDAELAAWAGDTELVDAIAIELHARRRAEAHDALLALETTGHPAARALQIDASARRDAWATVTAALDDPHHGPRAIATRWLARTGRIDGMVELADLDPAVREAALAARDIADAGPLQLVGDPDPWVARAATDELVHRWRDAPALPAPILAAARTAFASPDPWIRARACELPLVDDAALALAMEGLADPDEMVRSAALEALEHAVDLDARLAKLATLSDLARRMVHAWIHGDALPIAKATPRVESSGAEPRVAPTPATVTRRTFGRAGFDVAPLAISGAFDLSRGALHVAADAGVNLWFWEPAYDGLTQFLRPRRDQRVIAGSYHADAPSIEADVDRALRRLGRDSLDVFLLFWSRSPARVDAEAFSVLDRLKRKGKVRAAGFSTHHRALARTAIETSPWDVVMIRHSAAHPGIESELLPTARERGTAILTFSALCYGRMVSGPNAPSPADCYRYSLSQPGVIACISAPRRRTEVLENVAVLRHPTLSVERLAALREHGIGVRAENQRFNALLRQPTRDAAAAAREMLAAELPPSDEIAVRPMPRPTTSRGARTNLGRTRR